MADKLTTNAETAVKNAAGRDMLLRIIKKFPDSSSYRNSFFCNFFSIVFALLKNILLIYSSPYFFYRTVIPVLPIVTCRQVHSLLRTIWF